VLDARGHHLVGYRLVPLRPLPVNGLRARYPPALRVAPSAVATVGGSRISLTIPLNTPMVTVLGMFNRFVGRFSAVTSVSSSQALTRAPRWQRSGWSSRGAQVRRGGAGERKRRDTRRVHESPLVTEVLRSMYVRSGLWTQVLRYRYGSTREGGHHRVARGGVGIRAAVR